MLFSCAVSRLISPVVVRVRSRESLWITACPVHQSPISPIGECSSFGASGSEVRTSVRARDEIDSSHPRLIVLEGIELFHDEEGTGAGSVRGDVPSFAGTESCVLAIQNSVESQALVVGEILSLGEGVVWVHVPDGFEFLLLGVVLGCLVEAK